MERITNQELSRQINSLKEDITELKSYIKECNERTIRDIEENRKSCKENAVSIAGIKGASGVISIVVTFLMNVLIAVFWGKQ